ncbi:hypothetical protein FACS1894185_4060 [Betaproteobacteria bacterium]|nr:hypothetical protein FACS1894185_4060 [Betaproteobacteria bacterium]
MQVHGYLDGRLAVFHGQGKLADYDKEDKRAVVGKGSLSVRQAPPWGGKSFPGYTLQRFPSPRQKADNSKTTKSVKSKNS